MSGAGGKVMKGRMSSRIHDDISPQRLTEMEKSLVQKEKTFEVSLKKIKINLSSKLTLPLELYSA